MKPSLKSNAKHQVRSRALCFLVTWSVVYSICRFLFRHDNEGLDFNSRLTRDELYFFRSGSVIVAFLVATVVTMRLGFRDTKSQSTS